MLMKHNKVKVCYFIKYFSNSISLLIFNFTVLIWQKQPNKSGIYEKVVEDFFPYCEPPN